MARPDKVAPIGVPIIKAISAKPAWLADRPITCSR